MALGISNTVGGFFQCYSVCPSMSRSLIQETTGGKTQVSEQQKQHYKNMTKRQSHFNCMENEIVLLYIYNKCDLVKGDEGGVRRK